MKTLALVLMLSISSAFAQQNSDLVLPGAKWVATFNKYICAAFGPAVNQPADHAQFKVQFERIVTDASLDNGLITANYMENGVLCRYNAIVFADNAASTMRLVNSKAYAKSARRRYNDCAYGKAVLDAGFEANNYLYYGHPHNLAIVVPMHGASAICGQGQNFVGVNFVVTGTIRR